MAIYHPVIGLEVHVELKTLTKMFCDSPNNPGENHPNVNVCPVCLGHPGTLPTINKEAVKSVIRVGMALGGEINPQTKFDRKNYFYPDLPKGYQISQYDQPLVLGGSLNGVTLTRIHLEEDTGRLLHDPKTNMTLVDFNRAGVPLMELVTEPDIKSAEEAVNFARELQLILRYLDVSSADMEKGQMRVEVNISLGKWVKGVWKQGTKVEIKNLNSFGAVAGCIAYEIKRQENVLRGKAERLEGSESRTTTRSGVSARVHQETRGWDDVKKETVSQRSKEEAHDYRYFPEPDLPSFETASLGLEELKDSIPELPSAKRVRFKKEYSLEGAKLESLIIDQRLAEFFEDAISELKTFLSSDLPAKALASGGVSAKESATSSPTQILLNYLSSDLVGLMKENGVSFDDLKIKPESLAHLAFLINQGKILSRGAKDILKRMFKSGEDPEDILNAEGLHVVSAQSELEKVVAEIIAENPAAVADFKKGKTASVQFMIGKAMSRLKGRGNPETLSDLFKKKLT